MDREFEIRPYTYVFRGAGALGFELRDDKGRWIGVFDSCEEAERFATERGATVRKSWEAE